MQIIHGDCLDVLKTLPENSVDSLVTDPPAGISFMGKDWDGDKGGRKEWCAWMESVMRECLRVLKPGAHGLVWAIPRTSHWTATALEDAGFEVRDCITHLFGSGFPKSQNISIAIDKQSGAVGHRGKAFVTAGAGERKDIQKTTGWEIDPGHKPVTEAAKEWEGWGTALKPAAEFWWLVRKPLEEKTVAANVQKWKTGGINIDGSRIEGKPRTTHAAGNFQSKTDKTGKIFAGYGLGVKLSEPKGRFPANLVFSHSPGCSDDKCQDDCAVKALDGQNEGAFRFFYCAKISPSERNEGAKNNHPTVKPKKLMAYLIKLITPPNGIVLDPFMGSGSTGIAAKENAFDFIGIEREQEYFEISTARIESAKN